jgi:hypothetical protein
MTQRVRGEPVGGREALQVEQVTQPVTDRAPVQPPPPSSQNSAADPGNRVRTSSVNQRKIRSSPSSIGTHRGRGPEVLAPLPNRTWILPNGPRPKCKSGSSSEAASSARRPA